MSSISIYSSAFNLIKNNFDYIGAIKNFTSFADEVVIAVNESEDETFVKLKSLEHDFFNLKIIATNFSYDDPLLDGKIKNAALRQCSKSFLIGLDLDERIPSRHYHRWHLMCHQLQNSEYDAFLIPSINLWGSLYTVKKDYKSNLTFKWYLHKNLKSLKRGPVDFAMKPDGYIDTSKSDTCELVYEDNSLVKAKYITLPNMPHLLEHYFKKLDESLIYVFHLGYVDFQNRVDRNKNFWYSHWRTESNGEPPKHKVHMDVNEFNEETERHNLRLWNE